MRRSIARSVAAPWCALAILLAACTGSGAATEDDQPIEQPAPKPETPAEPDDQNNPDNPDAPDNPNNPENPNTPDNPDNPGEDAPQYEDVRAVLEEILGDSYDTMAGEISENKSITLTAQTIDAATDMFPVLASVVADSSKMNDAKTKVDEATDAVKKALVAQAEGKISLARTEKIYIGYNNSYDWDIESHGYDISVNDKDMKISLDGNFKYFDSHIESLNGNVDISNVTITSQVYNGVNLLIPGEVLKEEIYNKLNLEGKNPESLPTLDFKLGGDKELGLKYFLEIYDTYAYGKSEKFNLTASFGSMDGRTLVEGVAKDEYTLFEADGNTAKASDDGTIKSFNINELLYFTEKYDIGSLSNLIISGDAETAEVNWKLTNIIFEGDMSKLKNKSTDNLTGIVYFKGLPYDNTDVNYGNGQGVDGAVRLDELGTTNAKIKLNTTLYSIVDMRDIDEDKILKYNKSEGRSIVSYAGSIYFNGNIKKFVDDRSLYDKLFNLSKGGNYNNEYFGNIRRDFESSLGYPASKTPRELKAFEDYGNSEDHTYKTSAYDSYEDDFSSVTPKQKEELEKDKDIKKIAKVTTLCPLC